MSLKTSLRRVANKRLNVKTNRVRQWMPNPFFWGFLKKLTHQFAGDRGDVFTLMHGNTQLFGTRLT